MTVKYLIQSLLWFAALAAILFGSAGDIRWSEAWVFLAEQTLVSVVIIAWLARNDPALLRERFAFRFHRDQAVWDRLFFVGIIFAFVAWFVMIALDARRFGWSHVPIMAKGVGAILLLVSGFVSWTVFRVNTFAVPQARLQKSRAQTVVDSGPYRIVRHPMYSGALLFFFGVPLLLGSWFGLVAACALVMALAARSIGEERLLRRDLDAYAAKVRWRIAPGVW